MLARNHDGLLLEAVSRCKQDIIYPDLAEAIGIREALSSVKERFFQPVVVLSLDRPGNSLHYSQPILSRKGG